MASLDDPSLSWNPFRDQQAEVWQTLQAAAEQDTAAANADADNAFLNAVYTRQQQQQQRVAAPMQTRGFGEDNTLQASRASRMARAQRMSIYPDTAQLADTPDYGIYDDGWVDQLYATLDAEAQAGTTTSEEGYSMGAPVPQGSSTVNAAGVSLMSQLMHDYQLTPAQAAGVVGSLAHESGNFTQMQELQPVAGRGGLGYAQWTGPRRRSFEAWMAQRGLDASKPAANYGYLRHELDTTSEGRVLNAVRNATTASQSTQAFTNGFLRPGVVAMGARLNYANAYLNAYNQQMADNAKNMGL